ncbi:MAG UNVERIFIED_CONTAM: hypothetical protein LVR18_00840 [Planctomycetaceae bacterium]
MPLHQALREQRDRIRTILPRHEQGGCFAAQGIARSTGKVGVVMGTSGPGATNLVTGIADAKLDSVPMICITGQVPQSVIGSDAFQVNADGRDLPGDHQAPLYDYKHSRRSADTEGSALHRVNRPSGTGPC